MTNRTAARAKLTAKLKAQTPAQLRAIISALRNDHSEEAGIVHSAALDELMERIPEADFIAFCGIEESLIGA